MEEIQLSALMDAGQFTYLKNELSSSLQTETALKMNSPIEILVGETTLADNTITSYSASDFFDAMKSYYGSANNYANTVLTGGCGNELISYLAANYYYTNNFVRTLFTNNPTQAQAVWDYFKAPAPYPGLSAAATLQTTVIPVQDLYDQIGIEFSGIDVITEFETTISTATLESALQSFSSLKTCTRTMLGDFVMFVILDLHNRTTLWDKMIFNSTLSDLADYMITYKPGDFMMSAVELDPSRADNLFINLPVTYHVTDYLNAILNYAPFGTPYYTNMVNQLMSLGYVSGGWNYTVGEHHLYGSSRIGVHQTTILLRTRYASGEITITLEDTEYTQMYRGKRHYELSNHLGNVQVVISDKRISVCDTELEVEYFKAEVLSAMDYYPFGSVIPDRQWYANNDSNGFVNGFNGMRYDHEINGVGNSLDFGARIYDSRLGRWLAIDPKSAMYAGYSAYHFGYCNPIIVVDPNGEENIVIVGNQGSDPKSDTWQRKNIKQRHFLEAGLNEALNQKTNNTQNGEMTTMVVYSGNYTQQELDYYKGRATKAGVNFITVSTTDEIVNYVNDKNTTGTTNSRDNDLITDFAFVGHGRNDYLLPGYNAVIQGEDWDALSTASFSENAFHTTCNVKLNSCGSGYEVFDDFKNRLAGGEITGYNVTVEWGTGGKVGTYSPYHAEYFPPGDPRRSDPNRKNVPESERVRTETGSGGNKTNNKVSGQDL